MSNIVLRTIENQSTKDDKRMVVASLLSDEKPTILPENGENIDGLSEDDMLAPGTMIMTIAGDVCIKGIQKWGDWI